ncbi:MAG: formate/nitrite transporter family protein [Bacilli bacterium]|nr:formate/nitrite transporter family protein [Bacilli bacterium]
MIKTLIKGILAGIAISLGGWLCLRANAVMDNNFVGSFIFAAGLILIVNFDFYLYTGRICYLFDNQDKKNWLHLLLGLLGNLIGCIIMGLFMRVCFKDSLDSLFASLEGMINGKLNATWYVTAIKSFLCGMLVYLAVEGFKKIENNFGKYVVLVICIGGFVFAGYEHCVANMFYYALGNSYDFTTLITLLLCVLFNSVGGLFIPSLNIIMNRIKK